MTAGEVLRKARKKADLTQATLGERVGLSDRMISHMECGRKRVTYENSIKLAKALGISWKRICTGRVPMGEAR